MAGEVGEAEDVEEGSKSSKVRFKIIRSILSICLAYTVLCGIDGVAYQGKRDHNWARMQGGRCCGNVIFWAINI